MKTLNTVAICLLAATPFMSFEAISQPQATAYQPGVHSTAYVLGRNNQNITATITGIDKDERYVTLKGPKGKEVTVMAGPEIKNFDQLRVGDQVTAAYQSATAVEIFPADSAKAGVEENEEAERAAKGSKPGAAGQQSVSVTAKLTGIDMKRHTVTLTGADGHSRVIDIKDPARRARMGSLKVGEMVRITYVEALAVTVTPKSSVNP